MNTIRQIYSTVRIFVKNSAYDKTKILLDFVLMCARFGVLVFIYVYVYSLKGDTISGISLSVALWSMFLYYWFYTMRMNDIFYEMGRSIKSGSSELMLMRPLSLYFYFTSLVFGKNLLSFIGILFFGVAVMYMVIGFPPVVFNLWFFVSILWASIGGIILGSLLYTIVGMLAFYIEDSSPVMYIVNKSTMILGGSVIPVAFFPQWAQQLSLWIPTGSSYVVTHILQPKWHDTALYALTIQTGWIVILGFVVYFLEKDIRKKLSINGG